MLRVSAKIRREYVRSRKRRRTSLRYPARPRTPSRPRLSCRSRDRLYRHPAHTRRRLCPIRCLRLDARTEVAILGRYSHHRMIRTRTTYRTPPVFRCRKLLRTCAVCSDAVRTLKLCKSRPTTVRLHCMSRLVLVRTRKHIQSRIVRPKSYSRRNRRTGRCFRRRENQRIRNE